MGRRGRTFTTPATMLSPPFSPLSMTTSSACALLFLRIRRRSLTKRSRLSVRSLRLLAASTAELDDIKNQSGSMLPEDRVARTMDLQEDIAAKVEILTKNAATEKDLLPQGDKVPQDAQDFKDELNRITKYVTDLQAKTKCECDKYSEDVKFWAEYRTGIKEFT